MISPAPNSASPKILILGLGNDILTDDAIGLNVVRQLSPSFENQEAVEVRETMEMGLALLDFMTGYHDVIIVDAIQTGKAPAGTLHELNAEELKCLAGRAPHFLGVGETLTLGRLLGLEMPRRVTIFAVEVEDPFTLGTEMTPTLQRVVPSVLERVTRAVDEIMAGHASIRPVACEAAPA